MLFLRTYKLLGAFLEGESNLGVLSHSDLKLVYFGNKGCGWRLSSGDSYGGTTWLALLQAETEERKSSVLETSQASDADTPHKSFRGNDAHPSYCVVKGTAWLMIFPSCLTR